jgi:hypothetical protein
MEFLFKCEMYIVVQGTKSSATYIFPAKCCFAALTIDVSNSMESCEKHSLFCRPTTNIHPETYYNYVQYLINYEWEQITKLTVTT